MAEEIHNSDTEHQSQESPGHETRDARFRPLVLTGAGLLALIAIVLLVMYGLLELFVSRPTPPVTQPSPMLETGALPPEPRLQVRPPVDMQKHRAREDSILLSYGWIDRDAGIARVPIDTAMELLLKKGFPVRPNPGHEHSGKRK